MKCIIEINMDNAAFEDNGPATELARILRQCAGRAEAGLTAGALKDINGNTVGSFTVED